MVQDDGSLPEYSMIIMYDLVVKKYHCKDYTALEYSSVAT